MCFSEYACLFLLFFFFLPRFSLSVLPSISGLFLIHSVTYNYNYNNYNSYNSYDYDYCDYDYDYYYLPR